MCLLIHSVLKIVVLLSEGFNVEAWKAYCQKSRGLFPRSEKKGLGKSMG